MQRKKKGIIWLLVAVLILAAAYGGVLLFNKRNADTGIKLGSLVAEEINNITYRYQNQTINLVKTASGWVYPDDEAFPVDQDKANEMTTALAELTATRLVDSSRSNFETYGLAEPNIVINASTEAGASATYYIGGDASSRGYYLNIAEQNAVYLVDKTMPQCFSYDLLGLAQLTEKPTISVYYIQGVTRKMDGKTLEITRIDKATDDTYTAGHTWFFYDADGELVPVDAKVMEGINGNITNFKFTGCAAYNVKPQDLAAYGLAEPKELVVYYTDHAAEDPENAEILEMVLLVGDETAEGDYYAMLADTDMVVKIQGDVYRKLFETSEDDLIASSVCPIALSSMRALDIEFNGKSYHFDITPIVKENADGSKSTQYQYLYKGEEITALQFSNIFFSLTELRSEAKPTKEVDMTDAYITAVFTRDSVKFPRLTLRLQPYDASFYIAEFKGVADKLVNKRDIESFVAAIQAIDQL